MDTDLLKQLGQGGFAVALIGLLYLVGMRIVRALDKLGEKFDNHTTVDLEHHALVKEALVEVSTKIDTLYELTPVEQPKRRTAPRGLPVVGGQYQVVKRAKTQDDR